MSWELHRGRSLESYARELVARLVLQFSVYMSVLLPIYESWFSGALCLRYLCVRHVAGSLLVKIPIL